MEARPLRVAVVGVGHWHAPRHLAALHKIGEDIVAVWDPDPQVRQRTATETGARTASNLLDLLDTTKPEVIIGMGIHAQMPSLLASLIQVPAALILEKPLGIHAEDVAPLVEKVERDGRYAAVIFVNRMLPIWRAAKELDAAGRLGRPCYAHFRLINGPPSRYQRDGVGWMLDAGQSGGGSLINLGTHTLDAFRQFTGEDVRVVSAQLGNAVHGQTIEDYSVAILRSSSGALASVESGYCYAAMAGGDQEWRLITSNAYLVQRNDALLVQTLDDGKLQTLPGLSPAEAYHMFITESLRRFRHGEPPIATMRDGLKVLELVNDIYRLAQRECGVDQLLPCQENRARPAEPNQEVRC